MCVRVHGTVFGVLLGVQEGRCVEVCNSFELVVEEAEGRQTLLDRDYLTAKEEQCKHAVIHYSIPTLFPPTTLHPPPPHTHTHGMVYI